MTTSLKVLLLASALLCLSTKVSAEKPVPPVPQKPTFPISEKTEWVPIYPFEKVYRPAFDPDGTPVSYHRALFYQDPSGNISKVVHYAFGELASEIYDLNIRSTEKEPERWVRLYTGKEWVPEQYGTILKRVLRDKDGKITGVMLILKDKNGNVKGERTIQRPKEK